MTCTAPGPCLLELVSSAFMHTPIPAVIHLKRCLKILKHLLHSEWSSCFIIAISWHYTSSFHCRCELSSSYSFILTQHTFIDELPCAAQFPLCWRVQWWPHQPLVSRKHRQICMFIIAYMLARLDVSMEEGRKNGGRSCVIWGLSFPYSWCM